MPRGTKSRCIVATIRFRGNLDVGVLQRELPSDLRPVRPPDAGSSAAGANATEQQSAANGVLLNVATRVAIAPMAVFDVVSLIQALIRDPLVGGWLRHPNRAGVAWPCRREHDHDLHAGSQSRSVRCAKPHRQALVPPLAARFAANAGSRMRGALRTSAGHLDARAQSKAGHFARVGRHRRGQRLPTARAELARHNDARTAMLGFARSTTSRDLKGYMAPMVGRAANNAQRST
jgi:hypothetical protein